MNRFIDSKKRFDVVSNLTGGVLDVVQTAVESRCWRRCWRRRSCLDFAPQFDVLWFEHVLVVAKQPTGCQDRLLRQTADVEEAVELDGCRSGVAQLRKEHRSWNAERGAIGSGEDRWWWSRRLGPFGAVSAGPVRCSGRADGRFGQWQRGGLHQERRIRMDHFSAFFALWW